MILKSDGMTPFMPQDFRIGLDIGVFGRAIRITDADEYTRQFFTVSVINYSPTFTEPRSAPALSTRTPQRSIRIVKGQNSPSS
jgi:hypothetical protein